MYFFGKKKRKMARNVEDFNAIQHQRFVNSAPAFRNSQRRIQILLMVKVGLMTVYELSGV
jgi:hypothetical protein